MPVINDSYGNYYLGTYISPEGFISNQLSDLMDAAVGSSNNTQSGVGTETLIAWRPNIAAETFSGVITTTVSGANAVENARFTQFLGVSSSTANRFGYIRTTATTGTGLIPFDVAGTNETSLDKARNWATASNKSLGLFLFDDTNNYHFSYAAILNNAPGYVFPTNSVIITLGSVNGTPYGYALRPQTTAGSATVEYVTDANSNYNVICSNGASIPTVTELYFRDNNSFTGYPATGYGDNLLFARGTFNIGNPYFVEGVDGTNNVTSSNILGSDFRYFVCCGQMGNDFILMRVGQ